MHIDITSENYTDEVVHSDRPVLLDFWAPWCGPCRAISPVLDEIVRENPEIKLCKVNIDEEPALTGHFSVTSVPTIFVIKDGMVCGSLSGVQPKQQIMSLFDSHA